MISPVSIWCSWIMFQRDYQTQSHPANLINHPIPSCSVPFICSRIVISLIPDSHTNFFLWKSYKCLINFQNNSLKCLIINLWLSFNFIPNYFQTFYELLLKNFQISLKFIRTFLELSGNFLWFFYIFNFDFF
jgi:hypothetical protein